MGPHLWDRGCYGTGAPFAQHAEGSGFDPAPPKAQICNPSIWEVEVGEIEVQN